VITALAWLRIVDGVSLSSTDILGGAVALLGMLIIASGWGKAVT
jgi:small multidrug resistance family-3 protein